MANEPSTVSILYTAAKPVADAFKAKEDPGTFDLDHEQPFTLTLPLGVWRKLHAAVLIAERRVR